MTTKKEKLFICGCFITLVGVLMMLEDIVSDLPFSILLGTAIVVLGILLCGFFAGEIEN